MFKHRAEFFLDMPLGSFVQARKDIHFLVAKNALYISYVFFLGIFFSVVLKQVFLSPVYC